MRAAAVIALVAGLGLLLQTSVFHAIPVGRPFPDVLLVLCVYLGLHHHGVGGALGAFLLGYLQDGVSGSPAGLNSFGMVVVFVIVYLTCRRLWVDNVVSKVVLVFLASIVKSTAVVVLLALFGSFHESWGSAVGSLLLSAVFAAALAPPVFWILASAELPDESERR